MCPTVSPNAPECFRQREQWQWIARVNGRSTSNRTPPQRQLPPTVSAMGSVYDELGEPGTSLPGVRRALTERPYLGVLTGAFLIAFSGILYRKSHTSPTTGAFFRCFWALP